MARWPLMKRSCGISLNFSASTPSTCWMIPATFPDSLMPSLSCCVVCVKLVCGTLPRGSCRVSPLIPSYGFAR